MIWKYVIKSFRRRRVRTLLMVLSLIVATGLIVAMSATIETMRQSTVDLVAVETGRFDLVVTRPETYPNPFIPIEEASRRILAADDQIVSVHPRYQMSAEILHNGETYQETLVALDPSDGIGQVEIEEGAYELGDMQVALMQPKDLGLSDVAIGDTIDVALAFPVPREEGSLGAVGASHRQAAARLTVSGVGRHNGLAANFWDGLVIHIDDLQQVMGLEGQAMSLVVLVDPALYDAANAEAAALDMREVAINVQNALGEAYKVQATKAMTLDQMRQVFMIMQALVSIYGLMSLSVVGLLVYTLVMTNVQEQRRELAILRILGSKQKLLFGVVIVEVLVIGAVGVGVGVILGQLITLYGVVPLIEHLVHKQGAMLTLQPTVSLSSMLPAIVSAVAVLLISAIKPAQDASRTKVIHAINPGVADNIQLEDLEQLREQRPNRKIFWAGLGILIIVLLLNGQDLSKQFGLPAAEAYLFMVSLGLMIVGMAAAFFVLTRPLEKLVLRVMRLFSPRLTFFASRNVGRSAKRNTLISLLVLLSGVLPSFLATQSALSHAKIETDIRRDLGAPLRAQIWLSTRDEEIRAQSYLQPSYVHGEFAEIEGIDSVVGLTDSYDAMMNDAVAMRSGQMSLVGVDGDLSDVLYEEMIVWVAGGSEAFQRIQQDPSAIIVSQGMAEGMAIPLGGKIIVQGAGLDHTEEMTIVGIAQSLPGFSNVGRNRNKALAGGTALVGLEGYRRVTSNPKEPPIEANGHLLRTVLATLREGADDEQTTEAIYQAYRSGKGKNGVGIWVRAYETRLRYAQQDRATEQIMLLVLTLLSFITAVFGVFAVIFITIYSRRQEIGMMKAIGVRNKELRGMLSIESIAMTLGAALSGILAGTAMAYVYDLIDNLIAGRPQTYAFDTIVTPFVIVMVVLASLLGTALSAKRIIKHRAVDILRMS